MIRKLPHLAFLALSLLLANCSKSEPEVEAPPKTLEIHGQVFITQRNGVSIKLGGVNVHYVSRGALKRRSRWIEDNIPKLREIANYEKSLQRIDEVIQKESARKDSGKIRNFLSSAKDLHLDATKRFTENEDLKDYRALLSNVALNRESFEEARLDLDEEHQWALCALLSLPHGEAIASTKTDADGNYRLSVPASRDGVLFASSSRELGRNESERYYWVHEVSSVTSGPVHLSNDNTLSSFDLRDLVPPSPEAGVMSMSELVKEYGLRDLSWFKEAGTLLDKIAVNERSVAKLKARIKEVEAEMEAAKYRDMSTE